MLPSGADYGAGRGFLVLSEVDGSHGAKFPQRSEWNAYTAADDSYSV